ncbi:MAG: ABC transporter ATP-binding protein [Erysipelotrichaceae bacterium]|nr:ABC transporter ATP-binding protein [Erysipelotrichaceae bacterium]
MKNKEVLHFISNNIKGNKRKIVLLSIIQIILGTLTVAFSFMLRFLISSLEEKNNDLFIIYVIAMSSIALLLVGLQIFYRIYYEYCYVDIENKLKDNLYKTILSKDYSEIKKIHDEEWIHRLTSDVSVISSSILSILPSLCRMVVQLVLAIAAIIYLYPIFGLSLLPSIVFVILLTYLLRKRLKLYHKKMQEEDGKVKIFFFESLQGLSIIHSFVKEDIFSKKNEDNLSNYKKARMKRNLFSIACSIGYIVVYYSFYILAIIFCGRAILDNNMTIGLLTALIALLTQLTGPLGNITNIIPRYYSLIASGERIMIDRDDDISYLSKSEIDQYYRGEFNSIEIKHISYSYLDKYDHKVEAIKDLSLTINKNDKILIKGHSGGGKTTLFKLLLSLIKPDDGEILINGEPLSKRYERLFAYVPQDNLLMEGRIKDVITLYDNDVDEQLFNSSLHISESYDFINKLNDKENTVLNVKGSGLSLGEMERIAIARAIYSSSPILLLDECSASLDESTEKKVMNNILSLSDRTIILISHHKYDDKLFDKVIDLGE